MCHAWRMYLRVWERKSVRNVQMKRERGRKREKRERERERERRHSMPYKNAFPRIYLSPPSSVSLALITYLLMRNGDGMLFPLPFISLHFFLPFLACVEKIAVIPAMTIADTKRDTKYFNFIISATPFSMLTQDSSWQKIHLRSKFTLHTK